MEIKTKNSGNWCTYYEEKSYHSYQLLYGKISYDGEYVGNNGLESVDSVEIYSYLLCYKAAFIAGVKLKIQKEKKNNNSLKSI